MTPPPMTNYQRTYLHIADSLGTRRKRIAEPGAGKGPITQPVATAQIAEAPVSVGRRRETHSYG
jgi:hypothetical protein